MCVENVTPLSLSEEVSLDLLQKYYGGKRKTALKDASHTLHYNLEASLAAGVNENTDEDADTSEDYFKTANALAQRITDDPDYHDPAVSALYAEAVVLRAQLPVFHDRRYDVQGLSTDVMGLAHESMVRILRASPRRKKDDVLKLPFPESRRAELEMAGLLSRLGQAALWPYFATEREERSHVHSQYNHDIYIIMPDGDGSIRKVPIQIKSRRKEGMKKYDPRVLVLARSDLSSVVNSIDINHQGISKLLAAEEGAISYKDRQRLNSLSDYLRDRVQEHAETNLR